MNPPALVANANELTATKVVAEMGEPIVAETNLIWCGTFQLAWNEMIDWMGEVIRFANDEPAGVGRLNRRGIDEQQLDPDTFLAAAGSYTADFIGEVNSQVEERFGRGAFDRVEPPSSDDPRQLASMGFLSANLPFKHAFERTEHGADFKGEHVESFTLPYSPGSEIREEKAKRQVRVQYPPEENAFIVELITRKSDHHLILARVAPEATLAATIDKAMAYASSLDKKYLETNQRLEVPLFNFDLTRNYDELIGKPLTLRNPDFRGAYISRAEQKIRFQLDERGAELRSSSIMTCVLCAPPQHCVFDEPFLLMLRYRDSDQSYFAMWVDNAEILVAKGL